MKWVVRIVGLLVVLVVVAVIAILMLPAERIAKIATDQLRNVTGREVSINGDVAMTFWPVLGVKADQLEVGNAEWAQGGPMLTAASAAIGVKAASLLSGDIVITNIEAQSPTIRLEQRLDGRASWQFTDASGAAQIETETSPDRAAQPITIQALKVTDATLIYDAEGSDLVSYSGVDLTLDWPEAQGAAVIKAALVPAGKRVTLNATVQGFAGFLVGEARGVVAELSAPAGTAALNGEAALSGTLAGTVRLQTSNTGALLAQLGLPAVELPKGLGRSMDITAQMRLSADRQLAVRELVAELGGNALRGTVDLALNGTPSINADLRAGALDLSAPSVGSGESRGGASATEWSTAPIDASGLAAFNGSIGLQADSIDLGALKLGATATQLRNDTSRMVFDLQKVAAYGGALSGEFVINNRNGLSVGGKLTASGVQMQPLLNDLAGLTRFSGAGDARLSFLSSGASVDVIMRRLKGDGAINVGRGSIEGIDLDKLMGSFDVQGGTTVFDSAAASFAITNGVLRNDDLAMLLPNFTTTGAGQIDLGEQTLDYTVTPKALRLNAGKGIAVPVRVSGAWAAPKVRPDLKAAIDLNLKEEKERVEQQVKDKVSEKLEDELGVKAEEGQSVEDAVKDKVEDAVKDKLRSLFD